MYLTYIMRLNSGQKHTEFPLYRVPTRIELNPRLIAPFNSVTPSDPTIPHSLGTPPHILFFGALIPAQVDPIASQSIFIVTRFSVARRILLRDKNVTNGLVTVTTSHLSQFST